MWYGPIRRLNLLCIAGYAQIEIYDVTCISAFDAASDVISIIDKHPILPYILIDAFILLGLNVRFCVQGRNFYPTSFKENVKSIKPF